MAESLFVSTLALAKRANLIPGHSRHQLVEARRQPLKLTRRMLI